MLPRAAAAPARRRGADALPGLRVARARADASDRRARAQRVAAAVASGLLLGLALPPHDLDLLAFVALVPLLWAWREASWRAGAGYGFAFGIAYYGVVLAWSWHLGVLPFVLLVPANAVCFLLVGALAGLYTDHGVRSPWLTAAIWVVLEGLRDRWPFRGFPWGEVGLALHDLQWARWLASWGGIPLVTFLIVAANGWLLELGLAVARRRRMLVPLAALAAIVVVTAAMAGLRPQPSVSGTVRFALLQADTRNRELTDAEEARDLQTTEHFALAEQLRGRYDLVVFPESALERDPERLPALRDRIVALADRLHANVLVNARTAAPDGGLFNANLLYEPDGTLQGEYAKRHLVPFGEYIPYRHLVDWISALDRVSFDYTAGSRAQQFRAGGHRFESVICFESAFAPMTRAAVRDGAEYLVVSTSDRAFGRSGLSAQHVALSQMRAAETGRPVLHAAISGSSAVIDADGRVRQRTGLFERAITDGTIATTTGDTVYVRFGDWVVAACLLGLLATAVVARRRAPGSTVPPGPPVD